MEKTRKNILLWSCIVVCGFILLTIIVTFLGFNLPWTAHRESAVKKPETATKEWYKEHSTLEYSREEMIEYSCELTDFMDKFGVGWSIAGIGDGKYLKIEIWESDLFVARGLLNFFSKWYNVPIIYEMVPDGTCIVPQ